MKSSKGFKTIRCTREEMVGKAGSYGICDNCCSRPRQGIYVAVLNRWLCPGCYLEWHSRAVRYSDDERIEDKNYAYYRQLLGAEEEDTVPPGFRRKNEPTEADSCFDCRRSYYDLKDRSYKCRKYEINGVWNTMAFVCDDHKREGVL